MRENHELASCYKGLVGLQLSCMALKPLPSDTPDVVRELGSSSFSFSGGVELSFEPEAELFLTWKQRTPMTLIAGTEASLWSRGSLDRVQVVAEGPWECITGSRLVGVDLFTCPEKYTDQIAPLNGAPVAARHWLELDQRLHRLWIGTGWGSLISEADDLWVGVDTDPQNLTELELTCSIGARA